VPVTRLSPPQYHRSQTTALISAVRGAQRSEGAKSDCGWDAAISPTHTTGTILESARLCVVWHCRGTSSYHLTSFLVSFDKQLPSVCSVCHSNGLH
jgi:hypothetical protein